MSTNAKMKNEAKMHREADYVIRPPFVRLHDHIIVSFIFFVL